MLAWECPGFVALGSRASVFVFSESLWIGAIDFMAVDCPSTRGQPVLLRSLGCGDVLPWGRAIRTALGPVTYCRGQLSKHPGAISASETRAVCV